VYPYLETNVVTEAMSFSQEPIPGGASELSISKHGSGTPFRHHAIIRKYVESLIRRNDYEKLVSYNTTVELAEKVDGKWRLVLRKEGDVPGGDEWWEERFDALIVAGGHFSVPYIPKITGLADLERSRPRSVKHSKMFRGRDAYQGKRVVIVGAPVSAADIAYDLVYAVKGPVYAVVQMVISETSHSSTPALRQSLPSLT
jgi:cation diffusion facilitator CzcD-associated flavoprotein CzcO